MHEIEKFIDQRCQGCNAQEFLSILVDAASLAWEARKTSSSHQGMKLSEKMVVIVVAYFQKGNCCWFVG